MYGYVYDDDHSDSSTVTTNHHYLFNISSVVVLELQSVLFEFVDKTPSGMIFEGGPIQSFFPIQLPKKLSINSRSFLFKSDELKVVAGGWM